MTKQKFMITAVLLTIAAVIGAYSFRGEPPLQKGLAAQMVNAQNEPVTFTDLRGKVLFVNNWASWCAPCIAEMPSIQELKRKLNGVEVEFVMVSFDDDPSKAKAFIKKRNYDLDIYFPGQEYPFVTTSIPATFIIDKSGETVLEHVGMADYSTDQIVNQLKALANE
jgi:thiol-disulfide isomerase/thioredoxin